MLSTKDAKRKDRNSGLSENAREAQRRYMREYRRKNRKRIREINNKYWERKAAEYEARNGE